jgi:hypothetical protein
VAFLAVRHWWGTTAAVLVSAYLATSLISILMIRLFAYGALEGTVDNQESIAASRRVLCAYTAVLFGLLLGSMWLHFVWLSLICALWTLAFLLALRRWHRLNHAGQEIAAGRRPPIVQHIIWISIITGLAMVMNVLFFVFKVIYARYFVLLLVTLLMVASSVLAFAVIFYFWGEGRKQ